MVIDIRALVATKVLFLDIDGVLNCDSWYLRPERPSGDLGHLDPVLVQRVDEIAARSGAAIVISSAWRMFRSLDDLRCLLRDTGLCAPILDTTPVIEDGPAEGLARAAEILRWLTDHSMRAYAGSSQSIRQFAILDDLEDFGPLAHSHVHTETHVGIAHAHVEQAVALLRTADTLGEEAGRSAIGGRLRRIVDSAPARFHPRNPTSA
jgi:hypothetical protein